MGTVTRISQVLLGHESRDNIQPFSFRGTGPTLPTPQEKGPALSTQWTRFESIIVYIRSKYFRAGSSEEGEIGSITLKSYKIKVMEWRR